ncbi:putative integral membrane protein [Aspergillus lucknowensis]|uniref:Uncharacterized protein n=1 Tax=Aspergillus lucknowensis TaxID=176173 RepID=A0ABR4LXB1_9EURO
MRSRSHALDPANLHRPQITDAEADKNCDCRYPQCSLRVWKFPHGTNASQLTSFGASAVVLSRIAYRNKYIDSDFLNSTVEFAILLDTEIGLGIIAGSVAALGPLLRPWLGTASYNEAAGHPPVPRRSRLHRPRGIQDLSFPLSSLNQSVQSGLRPDKTATIVTDVRVRKYPRAADTNSSQERLTFEAPRGVSGGSDGEERAGVYWTCDVRQTSEEESSIERVL